LISLSGSSDSRKKELGRDQIGNVVVDFRAQEDDAVPQQPRVNIVRSLAAAGLLDNHRDQIAHKTEPQMGVFHLGTSPNSPM